MTSYAPAQVVKHPQLPTIGRSPEARHWRRYKSPTYIKEYAPIVHLQFAPSKPHRLAVTSSAEVKVYAPRTNKVVKNVSRFKETARSGEIREDGNLLVAGDDSGLVQVFNLNSREILKQIKHHAQPVHATRFSPHNLSQLLTASDDTTAALHDLTSSTPLMTFHGHTDYIRTAAFHPTSPSTIITGSYDTTVKLWDVRTGEAEMTLGHTGYAVECVLPHPSGGMLLSAGGPVVRAWDLAAGGKALKAVSNHQKTVTCLAWDGPGRRALSGSLDQMVKVWDVASWKVVHTMRYSAPILCLAISPDDTHIAAGLSDSTLSIRQRAPPKNAPSSSAFPADDTPLNPSTYTSFLSAGADLGQLIQTAETGRVKDKGKQKSAGEVGEIRVSDQKRNGRMRVYDRFLKEFRYGAALDAALKRDLPPTTSFTVIRELSARDGLRIALSGRDDISLEPVLRFLLRNITDTRFSAIAAQVTIVVLDLYAPVMGQSPLIDDLFVRLQKKVAEELKVQRDVVLGLKGMVDMLISNAMVSVKTAGAVRKEDSVTGTGSVAV
ncbi:Conserved WD40 repeat-containing protein [Phaffia rhodozyma]|uniref:Conserved WD40 repeat-containing protein n=1 Tax=Phaffia rhodozyma TaxID=264483 RepID=A0A0F7SKH4_PHARH|nr:Conserved WD40 repeat-containing protein [Phaffia rhodozyma]